MPLQIRIEGPQARAVVVCAHCGKQIENARQGNYQWRMRDGCRGTGGQLFFTHKQCCRAFQTANTGPFTWAWTELCCLPIFLGNNLGLDWEGAKDTARMFASIG
jgi:hypothetical protein